MKISTLTKNDNTIVEEFIANLLQIEKQQAPENAISPFF